MPTAHPSELPDKGLLSIVPQPQPERDPVTELPVALTPLVGRRDEVAAIRALVVHPDVRLVTLVGPGGIGKTRLALQVARELVGAFADGTWFVDLAPLSDHQLVHSAVAHTIGLNESGGRPLRDELRSYLKRMEVLLILDNFEHVLAAAPAAADLLVACPGLTMLATSRSLLRISGEHAFEVPPLTLPDPDQPGGGQRPTLADLHHADAISLFVQRARATSPSFALTEANARDIVAICRQLDGLPLAIELAAARSRLLPPDVLLARLAGDLRLLTGGTRDAPARQRTMRDTIAWSHALLSPAEQALFRRLAVFGGTFTLDAAEAVVEHPSLDLDVLEGIGSLVDQSLLRRIERPVADPAEHRSQTPPRFGMLETTREYALEQLAASGEGPETRRRHAEFYLALIEAVEPKLVGPEQIAWMDRIEAEHHNVRAALGWALDSGETVVGLRLAGALERFWDHRGHYSEGRRWLEALLASGEAPVAVRAKALRATGVIAIEQGDYSRAEACVGGGLELSRQLGDEYGTAFALNALGSIAVVQSDLDQATSYFCEALALLRSLGDADGIGALLSQLGYVALLERDCEPAATYFEEALAHYRELGSVMGSGKALTLLGMTMIEQGDRDRAARLLREGMPLNQQARHWTYVAHCMEGMAAVAASAEHAAQLWGAAEALRETIGAPIWPTDRARFEPAIAAARTSLGEAAFAAAWRSGRSLPLNDAIAMALASDGPEPPPPAFRPPRGAVVDHGFTSRELEVLRLLVAGRSDREIGEALFVTRRTVQSHVAAIFAKLGVKSRTAAATAAIAAGVVPPIVN